MTIILEPAARSLQHIALLVVQYSTNLNTSICCLLLLVAFTIKKIDRKLVKATVSDNGRERSHLHSESSAWFESRCDCFQRKLFP